MKKRLSLLLALLLALSIFPALGEGRYAEVYDTSQDAGKLVLRFVGMDTADKSKAGDSAIITSPDGNVMVIDAGSPLAVNDIIKALDQMGVTAIDMLVASHPHIDHVGGMPALLARYEVKAAYATYVDYDTVYTRAFLDALQKEGIPMARLARGDRLQLGEVAVDILWPVSEIEYYDTYPEASTQFINNLSLVMMLSWNGTRALFSGDLYTLGERTVLELGDDLKADVYKVNHHGDKTSSAKAWREAIAPQIAVITHNALADLRVPRKFEEGGSIVLHTLSHGAIRIASPGGGTLDILTEKDP